MGRSARWAWPVHFPKTVGHQQKGLAGPHLPQPKDFSCSGKIHSSNFNIKLKFETHSDESDHYGVETRPWFSRRPLPPFDRSADGHEQNRRWSAPAGPKWRRTQCAQDFSVRVNVHRCEFWFLIWNLSWFVSGLEKAISVKFSHGRTRKESLIEFAEKNGYFVFKANETSDLWAQENFLFIKEESGLPKA